MLTPIEIQNRSFKSGLGYDKKEVDTFLQEILESYESMYRDNMELKDKMNTLNEGLQYYKTIEKTLQKALVLAQKTAEDTKASAQQKAKLIEKEAENKAQEILSEAKNELHNLHMQIVKLIQQYDMYKAQFRNLAAAQIDILESESFQIHVANIDAFMIPDEPEQSGDLAEEYAQEAEAIAEEYEEEYSEAELENFDYIELED